MAIDEGPRMPSRLWFALAASLACLAPRVAYAEPPRGADEDALEDQVVDGEIDEEDQAAAPLRRQPDSASASSGRSWVSLVGFDKQLTSGRSDIGAMLVVGLALDRVAIGSVHRVADAPAAASPQVPSAAPGSTSAALVSPSLARECVAAALRTSGLGVDDAVIDSLAARARASAWLPDARARAMRLVNSAARTTTLTTTDGTTYYDAVGANLVLELRLTWHLDRLVYAGDEASLERTRLARQEARSRLASRTLDVLFAWQRAVVSVQTALAGSHEELQARLHASEAQATLDVLTGGWFSTRGE
jgi:hypothetical protein